MVTFYPTIDRVYTMKVPSTEGELTLLRILEKMDSVFHQNMYLHPLVQQRSLKGLWMDIKI